MKQIVGFEKIDSERPKGLFDYKYNVETPSSLFQEDNDDEVNGNSEIEDLYEDDESRYMEGIYNFLVYTYYITILVYIL